MTINLDDIKNYLRISHDKDDAVLANLLETAKSFAKIKTGVSYNENDNLYDLLLKYLIQHYYDNRSAIMDKNLIEVPMTITDLIKTITYRGPIDD